MDAIYMTVSIILDGVKAAMRACEDGLVKKGALLAYLFNKINELADIAKATAEQATKQVNAAQEEKRIAIDMYKSKAELFHKALTELGKTKDLLAEAKTNLSRANDALDVRNKQYDALHRDYQQLRAYHNMVWVIGTALNNSPSWRTSDLWYYIAEALDAHSTDYYRLDQPELRKILSLWLEDKPIDKIMKNEEILHLTPTYLKLIEPEEELPEWLKELSRDVEGALPASLPC